MGLYSFMDKRCRSIKVMIFTWLKSQFLMVDLDGLSGGFFLDGPMGLLFKNLELVFWPTNL